MVSTLYIIVTYQGERYIQTCIESVRKNDPDAEIWVYDNNSTDRTRSILSGLGVKYSSGPKNIGFGAANNIGLGYFLRSTHSHCFLLNQDAYITADTLQAYDLASIQPHSIIAPLQLTGDGVNFDKKFRDRYLNHEYCPNFYSDHYFGRLMDLYPLEFAPAAAWIMPKEVVERVGGFSPTFFHYGEDDNYVQRCHYHGIALYLAPKAIVLHDRQDRTPDPVHMAEKVTRRRRLLLKLSNPNRNGAELRSRVLSCLSPLTKYPLQYHEVHRAVQNRNLSKIPGATFLSRTP